MQHGFTVYLLRCPYSLIPKLKESAFTAYLVQAKRPIFLPDKKKDMYNLDTFSLSSQQQTARQSVQWEPNMQADGYDEGTKRFSRLR